MRIRFRQPRLDTTVCPLCRDTLWERGSVGMCGACETHYHASCIKELGGCGTLGCSRKGRAVAGLPQSSRPRIELQRGRGPFELLADGLSFGLDLCAWLPWWVWVLAVVGLVMGAMFGLACWMPDGPGGGTRLDYAFRGAVFGVFSFPLFGAMQKLANHTR